MDKVVFLENGMNYLTEDEFKRLYTELSEVDIRLEASSETELVIKHSLWSDVVIYVGANITELIVNGMISPMVFSVFKATMRQIVLKIQNKVKLVQSNTVKDAQAVFKFKNERGEIMAEVPSYLSDEQFEKYMDNLKCAMELLSASNDAIVIAEANEDLAVEICNLHEYALRQKRKESRKVPEHKCVL